MKKRVVVGISGGVDSSVAAFLLQRQGYEVRGLFMINWHDTTGTLAGDCPWNDDLIFAELVAKKLGIPLQVVDFSEEYRRRVVDYMFREYERGRTPNPDVLCNREIKFDLFTRTALELGADYIATGHYCRKDVVYADPKDIIRLLCGTDADKDQSYFLCQLSQQQLRPVLFPVGSLYKKDVRQIAREQNLATAGRKDSQGICFVGKVDLPGFLKQKLKPRRGPVIEIPADHPMFEEYRSLHRIYLKNGEGYEKLTSCFRYTPDDGRIVGEHDGAHYFTIGQRKGLNIGGMSQPLFVIATDTEDNRIYVGMGHAHGGLNRWGLRVSNSDLHWIRDDQELREGESRDMLVRVRYRQPLQQARLTRNAEGLHIVFDKRQRGITPGQFAAWYQGEELIGSGVIG